MLALAEAILEAAPCSCGSGELGEVVGGADQGPFGPHFVDAAQQELPEAPCLFDLSEYRLDGLLSQSVAASMAGAFKLGAHSFDERAAALALGHSGLGAMLLPAGGNVAVPTANSIRLARRRESDDALSDGRLAQTDMVGDHRAVPIKSLA